MVSNGDLLDATRKMIDTAERKIIEEHMFYYKKHDDGTNKAHRREEEKDKVTNMVDGEATDHGATEGIFDYLYEKFDNYTFTTDAYETPLAAMDDARANVSNNMTGDLIEIVSKMDHWQGEAAYSFQESFLLPFCDAVGNIENLTSEVREGLAAQQRIALGARESAYNIAVTTTKVLEEFRPGDSPGNANDVIMPIVNIVTAFVGLKTKVSGIADKVAAKGEGMTATESVDLPCGLLSSATQVFNSMDEYNAAVDKARPKAEADIDGDKVLIKQKEGLHTPGEPFRHGIAGDGVFSIIDSAVGALGVLRGHVTSEEDSLKEKLGKTLGHLEKMFDGKWSGKEPHIRPMKPDFVENPPKVPGPGFYPND